jgi:hypothetical protein
MAVAATAANTVQLCCFSEVGKAMGQVHYFQEIMWKNKYGLVIFLLALLLGIICDLRMSLVFRVNIFMFVSSKTEPQKIILLIFVFSVSRHKEN